MVHGFRLSILPQFEQVWIMLAASERALAKGVSNVSRLRIKAKTARLAERGPSPGSLESNLTSLSISGLVMPIP